MPDDPFPAIKAATLAGKKIAAIKLYRDGYKVNLGEAKDAVEKLEAELRNERLATLPGPVLPDGHTPLPADKLAQIRNLVITGQKIAAIQVYREVNPVSLVEAKTVIDGMEKEIGMFMPLPPAVLVQRAPASTLVGFILLLMIIAAVVYGIWSFVR